ncbi:MAG: type II/IV secretion system protein, partial [Alphaproteobacteria bacterium]|nr:type II/IV secretion system protein [Alphaproteobacteria bacterium]
MAAYTDEVAEKVIRVLQTANRIDVAMLEKARGAEGAAKPGDILELLLRDGGVEEDLVQTVLSRAYAIRRLTLDANGLDSRALGLIPPEQIDKNKAMPFAVEGRFLKLAIVDPTTASLAGQFKSLSNFNIEFQLIPLSVFEELRSHEKVKTVLEPKKSASAPPRPSAGGGGGGGSGGGGAVRSRRSRFPADNDELVPEFCDHILATAIDSDTSDIHIEPFRGVARIRFRVDGRLVIRDEYTDYLIRNYLGVVTRFKIMADCDISEKRLPQDGAITIVHDGEDIDFRFNVLPGKNGERIVMRILKGDPSLSLDRIGLSEKNLNRIIEAISAPQGMVLVTGPTGSGKTTTLYGALQWINEPQLNIMTAEDPVEYYLEGIGQVQANEKIGLTFSSILRAFLRQDPEVILVGEIRDQETVDIAVKAALTGHLLLSTLHTNDAIATITRLMNMGVPPFMISAAVSLIVAQRLARANCQNCLVEDTTVTREFMLRIGFSEE